MKRLLLNTLIGLALLTCQTSFAQKTKAKFSPIKVETPARPANQQDVIQLVTPKLETVRVGFIWRKPVCLKPLHMRETRRHGKNSANGMTSTSYI